MSVQNKFKIKGSKTTGLYRGKYFFKLCYFLQNGDIYCKLFNVQNRNKHGSYWFIASGYYDVNEEKFKIKHIPEGVKIEKIKKRFNYFLEEYGWEL